MHEYKVHIWKKGDDEDVEDIFDRFEKERKKVVGTYVIGYQQDEKGDLIVTALVIAYKEYFTNLN